MKSTTKSSRLTRFATIDDVFQIFPSHRITWNIFNWKELETPQLVSQQRSMFYNSRSKVHDLLIFSRFRFGETKKKLDNPFHLLTIAYGPDRKAPRSVTYPFKIHSWRTHSKRLDRPTLQSINTTATTEEKERSNVCSHTLSEIRSSGKHWPAAKLS